MNLTDILSAVNPFKQKATNNKDKNLGANPLPNFGGIIGGRPIYPNLDYQKFVADYTLNSEVYSVVKRICKTVSTVPFYVYKVKNRKELTRYKSTIVNAKLSKYQF